MTIESNIEIVDLKAQSAEYRANQRLKTIEEMAANAPMLQNRVNIFNKLHYYLMQSHNPLSVSAKDSIFNQALKQAGITSYQLSYVNSGDLLNPEWAFEAGI